MTYCSVLEAVREAYARAGTADADSPSVSVVVCTYNGAATLGACLDSLEELRTTRPTR